VHRMSILDAIMRQPLIYRLWMGPFAKEKFAPIAAHNDLARIHRVLDVGCGPGTNAYYFSSVEYLGIDLNEQYIRDAGRRYGASQGRRRFLAVDAAKFVAPPGERFDFVLVNSFFHHVDDATVTAILSNLGKLLTDDGCLHILDLVLPESMSVPRILARCDRGNFPRPLEKWRQLFCEAFEQVLFEPYDLGGFGLTLWKMVYFKGKARRHSPRP
jgi:SAM-dependent methyltransferase